MRPSRLKAAWKFLVDHDTAIRLLCKRVSGSRYRRPDLADELHGVAVDRVPYLMNKFDAKAFPGIERDRWVMAQLRLWMCDWMRKHLVVHRKREGSRIYDADREHRNVFDIVETPDGDRPFGSGNHNRFDDRLGAIDNADMLRGVFDYLSRRDRNLLKWRHVDGLSHRQIGLRLGITRQKISVLCRRAMNRAKAIAACEPSD